MKNRKLANAIITSFIVTSLAATPAFAESATQTTSGQTTSSSAGSVKLSFPDVKSDYWGIRHISKLALEGIIEGFEDGTYRAENSVSQQDVLIMATRMMGLQSEVDGMTASTVFPDFMQVDNYARNYVAVALQKGLISNEEEKARAQGDTSKEKWGQRKATREWVAEIVVRAIGKTSVAQSSGSAPSTFNDNSDISSSALGYVNAAVSLGIVDGFEDGSFQPKGAVTRAQMAAFLSRSQKELDELPQHAVRGYLAGLTSGTISVMDKDGNTSTYKLSSNVAFYGNKDDNPIASSVLQETYEVSLIQVNGTAYYVEILNDELQMDVYDGKLLKLNMTKLTATLDDYESYSLASDVTVTDKDGRGLSLGSIVEGSTVELRRNRLTKTDKITSIIVKQVPVNKTANGIIQTINKTSQQMGLLESTSAQTETFGYSSNLIVTLPDNSLVDINLLHTGDTVEYTVSNSEIVKVSVTKQADVGITVEGTLKTISDDKTILTITRSTGNPYATYALSDNVQVVIDGLPTASLYDLADGDNLKLEVLNNKITLITVTNRSIENLYFAKISNYDSTNKILTVVDNESKPHAYQLTDSISIKYGSATLQFSNFSSMFTVGKYVDLLVSKDNVTAIKMSTEQTGTLTQLNLTTNELTLKTDSGQSLNFNLTYTPTVEIPNKSSAALSDLKVGDKIDVNLSYADQSMVLNIYTIKSALYKAVSTNNNSNLLTVSDDSGSTYDASLDGVTILKADQTAGAITDILADNYVKLSYKGNSVTKVELVDTIRGKVTAADSTSNTLTVEDFSGASHVISATNNFAVKLNGGSTLSFTSIKVGDRVQINKDAADKVIIQVASSATREFVSYNNIVNQMNFKAVSSGDKTAYSIFPRAYYHKDTVALTASSFQAGDQVMVYVLDGKIVEMNKQ